MADIATQEPENFIAGDTVKWKRSLDDYKASASWVLKYALRGAGTINLTATASGDDHLITIAAATSAGYTPGTYSWIAYVEKAGERYTIAQGYTTIKANLATATSVTDRLLSIEADITAINGYLSKNYKFSSYAIAGRSLNQHSITDLFTLKDRLQRELNTLRSEEKIRRGLDSGKIIRVRMQPC